MRPVGPTREKRIEQSMEQSVHTTAMKSMEKGKWIEKEEKFLRADSFYFGNHYRNGFMGDREPGEETLRSDSFRTSDEYRRRAQKSPAESEAGHG